MKKLALSFAALVFIGLAAAYFDNLHELEYMRLFALVFVAVWVLSIYNVIEYNRKN